MMLRMPSVIRKLHPATVQRMCLAAGTLAGPVCVKVMLVSFFYYVLDKLTGGEVMHPCIHMLFFNGSMLQTEGVQAWFVKKPAALFRKTRICEML